MGISKLIRAAGIATIASVSSAIALPVQWSAADGGNDHWYEAIVGHVGGNGSWFGWVDYDTAQSKAEALNFNGIQGHILTITSAEEQAFVVDDVLGANSNAQRSDRIWLGAQGASNNADSWVWNQGPESGQKVSETYSNWQNGALPHWAPNDGRGVILGWTPEWSSYRPNQNSILVVEYSTSAAAAAELAGPSTVPSPASGVLLLGALGLAFGAAQRSRRSD